MPNYSENAHRIHPRLRVIANGSGPVNACRSKISTQVSTSSSGDDYLDDLKDGTSVAALQTGVQTLAASPLDDTNLLKKGGFAAREKLEDSPAADTAFVNVIIEVMAARPGGDDVATREAVERITKLCDHALDKRSAPATVSDVISRGTQISATVPISFLSELGTHDDIGFISITDPLKLDIPTSTPAAKPTRRKVGKSSIHMDGEGAIIGIIDVGGFDFAHPDFLDDSGQTRFLRIWDQGGDFRAPPSRFGYGSEFTDTHLNAALAASGSTIGVPAVLIERHPTHQILAWDPCRKYRGRE